MIPTRSANIPTTIKKNTIPKILNDLLRFCTDGATVSTCRIHLGILGYIGQILARSMMMCHHNIRQFVILQVLYIILDAPGYPGFRLHMHLYWFTVGRGMH